MYLALPFARIFRFSDISSKSDTEIPIYIFKPTDLGSRNYDIPGLLCSIRVYHGVKSPQTTKIVVEVLNILLSNVETIFGIVWKRARIITAQRE